MANDVDVTIYFNEATAQYMVYTTVSFSQIEATKDPVEFLYQNKTVATVVSSTQSEIVYLSRAAIVDKYKGMIEANFLQYVSLYVAQEIAERATHVFAQVAGFKSFNSKTETMVHQSYMDAEKKKQKSYNWYIHGASEDGFSRLSHNLPNMDKVLNCPDKGCRAAGIDENGSFALKAGSTYRATLRSVIIHLNDGHRWTREAIADWLDELHDSGQINIEFEVEVEDLDAELKELTSSEGGEL